MVDQFADVTGDGGACDVENRLAVLVHGPLILVTRSSASVYCSMTRATSPAPEPPSSASARTLLMLTEPRIACVTCYLMTCQPRMLAES